MNLWQRLNQGLSAFNSEEGESPSLATDLEPVATAVAPAQAGVLAALGQGLSSSQVGRAGGLREERQGGHLSGATGGLTKARRFL